MATLVHPNCIKDTNARHLLIHLVEIAGVQRKCSPTISQLATNLDWSKDTVIKYLNLLETVGEISVNRNYTQTGQNGNTYTILSTTVEFFAPVEEASVILNQVKAEASAIGFPLHTSAEDPFKVSSAKFRAIVRSVVENNGWTDFEEDFWSGQGDAAYITTAFKDDELRYALTRCSLEDMRDLLGWYLQFRFQPDPDHEDYGCDADVSQLLSDIDYWLERKSQQDRADVESLLVDLQATYNQRKKKYGDSKGKQYSETAMPGVDSKTFALAGAALAFFKEPGRGGLQAIKDSFLSFIDEEIKNQKHQRPLNYFFHYNNETSGFDVIQSNLHLFNTQYSITTPSKANA